MMQHKEVTNTTDYISANRTGVHKMSEKISIILYKRPNLISLLVLVGFCLFE